MSGPDRSPRQPQPAPRAPTPPDAQEAPPPAALSAPPAPAPLMTAIDLALDTLRQMGETARALGLALGFNHDMLAAAEVFDRLEGEATRAVEAISDLDKAPLKAAFALFSADLELDLALAGLDPDLDPISAELRAGRDPLRALADFRAAAEAVYATQGESVSVDVRLRLGKSAALAQAQRLAPGRVAPGAPPEAPVSCTVFYTEAALRRLLSVRAATLWRDRGLGGEERRALVALCEGSGYLAGVALEVIGAAGPVPKEWLSVMPQAWRRFLLRVGQARALRDGESAWSGLDLPFMPDHLRVVARMPGLEAVADQLAGLRAAVAACALASDLSADGVTALMRFAGTRPAALRLDLASTTASAPPGEMSATANGGRLLPETEPEPLVALSDWAYRDASPDRLAIARDALGRELPVAADVTLADTRAAAGPALAAARANLALYLRGSAERYFQARAAAQAAISAYADATRKAVTDLTGDVVDNLVKTVGLVVGVVIASLIQPTVTRLVATLAAALYVMYIVFIIGYLLRARHARYALERQALRVNLDAMSELTHEERRMLRAPAVAASAHFDRYYRATFWIYVALAVAGAVLLILLQTPLWPVLSPPAVSPTVTPAA